MKGFLKKAWAFIYKPNGWFSVVSVLSALVFAALSLVAVFTGNTAAWWIYPIYALAALSLFCAAFACIYHGKHFRQNIQKLIGRYAFTQKLCADKEYRLKASAIASLAIGLCYTAFLAVMAVLEGSFWYASLAEFNGVFCLTRFFVLHAGRKAAKLSPIEGEKKKVKAYALSGGLMILVGIQFAFAVLGIVFRGETFRYAGMMIYVFAAFTFYKATMAIVRLAKIRKHNDTTVRSIISYNLAGAATSLVSLQTAMFDAFGGDAEINVPAFNGATGSVVCLFLLALGLLMLVGGIKTYKRMESYQHGK